MITVTKPTDENYEVSASTRPPSIYLDTWALRLFSSDPDHRQKLLTFFRANGTLLFSLTNILEISRITGNSAKLIRDFLAEVGEQWFPLEFNPIKVIEAEYAPRSNSPCFATSFLEAYYPFIHEGPLSLTTLIDLIHDDEIKPAVERGIQTLTSELSRMFQAERDLCRSNPLEHKTSSRYSSFDPNKPAESVYKGLMELVIKENFGIDDNHVLDFCHATVSLAYGDLVLLDKHWRELARKLGRPSDRVRVYSQRQVDQFFDDIRQFEISARN